MSGQKGQVPAADVLMRLLAQNYWLGRTGHGQPFAVRREIPSVMISLRGPGGLRQRLAADMFRLTGRAATSNALTDVLNMAEGMAADGWSAMPHLRVASHLGMLYLDLGRPDGMAVELRPGGWRVVERPPVLFARTAMTGELPLPAEHGELDGTRDMINIAGPDEWALYTACRVASLIPGITHPVELITGLAGSAKTATTRMTANWMDPSEVMIPVPRDGRTWASIGGSRYVLPVDNVSWIPSWWSDLLCKAASGDGWVDRALYTDGDVFVSKFQSVILLNGISLGALRGDLADRIVWHRLARPSAYRSDDEMAVRWTAAHPGALAWLLDQAAAVMASMMHQPEPAGQDRLARFAQVVQCVDSRWRTQGLLAWRSGRADVLEDVAEGDPVAVAIRKAVREPLVMTSTDLLLRLRMTGGLEDERSGRAWTPKTLSEHIERSQGALESLGWHIWKSREGRGSDRIRMWNLAPPGWSYDGSSWSRKI